MSGYGYDAGPGWRTRGFTAGERERSRSLEFTDGATYTQAGETVHAADRAGGLKTDRPVPPVRRQPLPYPETLEMHREAEFDRMHRHSWY